VRAVSVSVPHHRVPGRALCKLQLCLPNHRHLNARSLEIAGRGIARVYMATRPKKHRPPNWSLADAAIMDRPPNPAPPPKSPSSQPAPSSQLPASSSPRAKTQEPNSQKPESRTSPLSLGHSRPQLLETWRRLFARPFRQKNPFDVPYRYLRIPFSFPNPFAGPAPPFPRNSLFSGSASGHLLLR
jgi:hypothetical protein